MSEQKMWALRRRSDKVLRLVSSDKEEVKRRAINRSPHGGTWADILKEKRHRACDSRIQAARCNNTGGHRQSRSQWWNRKRKGKGGCFERNENAEGIERP